ncbi:MAG: HIT family protein [Lactobacillus sp.]|nr:HIT family protein [Lactobacillus sp.]
MCLDANCLFCKIIKGEIPSYTVFENDDVKAFLDISQVNEGHVLMIPKKHLVNILDYSDGDAQKYLQYIPKIAKAIMKAYPEYDGLNVTTNNGESAGQVVMHSHIHFIPRKTGDGLNVISRDNSKNYDEASYTAVMNKIKDQL